MSVLDPQKTIRNLKKKGFKESTVRSHNHIYLEFFHEKRLVVHTKVSHHSSDLDNYLIKQMAVQCKLEKEQFFDLAKCPMNQEEYERVLGEKGFTD